MGDKSNIEWTDATWNPIVGCSIYSPGCTNCYAMGQAARIQRMAAAQGKGSHYTGTTKAVNGNDVWTGKVQQAPDHIWTAPLGWKKPRKIFVNSMGDVFHESVPDVWIDKVFAVMALCPQHTFQCLTKRSKRMREYMLEKWQPANAVTLPDGFIIPAEKSGETRRTQIERACEPLLQQFGLVDTENDELWTADGKCKAMQWHWPLPNVWLGVSAEDQTRADERIPDLLATPAAVRFVSAEPLLGPINFGHIKFVDGETQCGGWMIAYESALNGERFDEWNEPPVSHGHPKLDWIIAGGESGDKARPMHPDWARSIRDQCAAAGVAFFFKQWGEFGPCELHPPGTARLSTLLLDGRHLTGKNVLDHPEDNSGEIIARFGKSRVGRLLDGIEHNAMPESSLECSPIRTISQP